MRTASVIELTDEQSNNCNKRVVIIQRAPTMKQFDTGKGKPSTLVGRNGS